MTIHLFRNFALAAMVFGLTALVRIVAAADAVEPLIEELASEMEEARAHAIDETKKLGDAAVDTLRKTENEVKLAPRQLVLVRKILGDRLIQTTPLTPVDLNKMIPFGEKREIKDGKEVVVVPGDPNLLFNRELK